MSLSSIERSRKNLLKSAKGSLVERTGLAVAYCIAERNNEELGQLMSVETRDKMHSNGFGIAVYKGKKWLPIPYATGFPLRLTTP